jgi:hypothetical protein
MIVIYDLIYTQGVGKLSKLALYQHLETGNQPCDKY